MRFIQQAIDYEARRQQQQERLLTLFQELTGSSLTQWRPDAGNGA